MAMLKTYVGPSRNHLQDLQYEVKFSKLLFWKIMAILRSIGNESIIRMCYFCLEYISVKAMNKLLQL